ncbi:hypothetical protein HDV02_000623, partial [Globomyces sp. JEL0801]
VSVNQKQEVADPKKLFLKRFQQKPAPPKYDRQLTLTLTLFPSKSLSAADLPQV